MAHVIVSPEKESKVIIIFETVFRLYRRTNLREKERAIFFTVVKANVERYIYAVPVGSPL